MSDNIVAAEECYTDMKAIMERIKKGETGRQICRDIDDLKSRLEDLRYSLEESQ
jgi:hypothetical protein